MTASILYNLVHCPARVALDAFGDPAERDEVSSFVRLLWERGSLFERETIDKLDQLLTDLSTANDRDCERLTLEAMERGDPLIYRGRTPASRSRITTLSPEEPSLLDLIENETENNAGLGDDPTLE